MLLLFSACGSNNDAHLIDSADFIMEENPDSALTLLDQVDISNLNHEYSARYALLVTQAKVKTDIFIPNDSLISIAVEHFSKDKHSNEYMRAAFYEGFVLNYYNNQTSRAVVYAMQAYEIAKQTNNYYWLAKSAEMLEDIMGTSRCHDEMLHYAQEAVDYYQKADKILNHQYAICDMASALCNLKRYDEAEALLDSIATVSNDSALIAYSYRAKLGVLYNSRQYDKGITLAEEMKKYTKFYRFSIKDLAFILSMELSQKRSESADERLKDMMLKAKSLNDRGAVILTMIKYYEQKGDYKTSQAYTDSLLKFQNEALESLLKQSTTSAQRDYYSQTSAIEHSKMLKTRYLLIAIVIFVILAAVALTIIIRQRFVINECRLEDKMQEVVALTKQIKDFHLINSRLKAEIENTKTSYTNANGDCNIEQLFKEKWQTLDMLCDEYFRKSNSPNSQESIIQSIEDELEKIRCKKNLLEIVDSVDKYMGNIISELKVCCPAICKEEDIIFIALIFAGFSPRSICFFTGIKLKYYYNKRSRIIARIEANCPENAEYFTSKMR